MISNVFLRVRLERQYRHFQLFTNWLTLFHIFLVTIGEVEAWIVLLARSVDLSTLAQGAQRQFSQWLWFEHPTFQLRGGYFTTELLSLREIHMYCRLGCFKSPSCRRLYYFMISLLIFVMMRHHSFRTSHFNTGTLRLHFWASSSNHCLAALDLGPGVEQPFDCLIVQNRQVVQSMRRSVDVTSEGDMLDSLFCSTLTGAEEAIPHLYKQERKRPILVRIG